MNYPNILMRVVSSALLHLLGINSLRGQLSQTQPAMNRPPGGRAILAAHFPGTTAQARIFGAASSDTEGERSRQ